MPIDRHLAKFANPQIVLRRRLLEDVRCLSFENGISLRPTLSKDRPHDFGMHVCTRVELELKPGVIQDPDQIEILCNIQGHKNFRVRFKDYVAAMVSGVNVPVFVESDNGCVKVHEKFPPEAEEREPWLRSLSYVVAGVNEKAMVGLTHAVPRLRPIRDGDKVYGLAAIAVLGRHDGLFLSAKSVGGLVPPHNRYDDSFIGLIDHAPASAKRDAGEIAAPKRSVDAWLFEQLQLLKNEGMSQIESLVASYSVCQLGYDPKDVLQGLLVASSNSVNYWSMRAIGTNLESGLRLGFAVSAEIGILDQYTPRSQVTVPGIWICVVVRNGKFNEAKLLSGVPAVPHSLIGVVHRVLTASGHSPQWRITEGAYSSFLGRGDMLEVAI